MKTIQKQLGLAGLLSTFMRWESIDSLEIYGGAGALERVRERFVHPIIFIAGDDEKIVHSA